MKILITGASGFLGRSLSEFYTNKGHTVLDFKRGFKLSSHLNSFQPELIIHCAGEIYTTENMYDTNIGMTHEILEWIREHPVTRMIHIGSSSEYGDLSRPSKETDRINPLNIYEATKGAGTLLCQGYARQFKLDICVARIYSGYGAYEKERRLFPTLYRAFFKNEPMKLYDGVHDFIYIDDFVRGIDTLVTNGFIPGDIINFGSGVQYRNVTVLRIWEVVTGQTAPVEYLGGQMAHAQRDAMFWQCDTSYAENQYGFKAEYTLEAGITDFIKKKHEQSIT
jgi:nucleoside-diphosphate-sugar epimerase